MGLGRPGSKVNSSTIFASREEKETSGHGHQRRPPTPKQTGRVSVGYDLTASSDTNN